MVSTPVGSPTSVLGTVAIAVAAINVFGGFAVSVSYLFAPAMRV
jgi:NAD/NADP transhydrogenase alpha subunit